MASASGSNSIAVHPPDTLWNIREPDKCIYQIDGAKPAMAISSFPPSSREFFRRRREIHDAANLRLYLKDSGPILGRDDSIIYTDDDEVYVVDHEGVIGRDGDRENEFPSPIQRIDYCSGVSRGVVQAQMWHREHVVPTHSLLSTTGCFALAMIKVQRKFRFNRVLRMLGTYHLLPSSLQHHMELRDLVARFLCGPPVQRQCDEAQVNLTADGEKEFQPRPKFLVIHGCSCIGKSVYAQHTLHRLKAVV